MNNRAGFVAFCYTLIVGLVAIYFLTQSPAWLMFAGMVAMMLMLTKGEE